jgi:hypothetical protein
MTDRILGRHDIISSRSRKATGHFGLFRNAHPASTVYQRMPGVRDMLEDSATYHEVDERKMTRFLRANKPIRHTRGREVLEAGADGEEAITVYWRRHLAPEGKDQHRAMERGVGFTWKDGRTFDDRGRELMYLHFHRMKKTMHTIDFDERDAPRAFRITPDGVFAGQVRP